MNQRWIPHLLGLLTPLSALVGLWLGGLWMGLTAFLLLGIYPLLDVLSGQSSSTEPLQEGKAHDLLVHLHALLVPVVVIALLGRVSLDGFTSMTILGVISTGLSCGASGIVSAHELGHRRLRSPSWWLARLSLLSVLYLHFTTEHNHTHHRHWARDKDPTSSPWGRNMFTHFVITVPRQIAGAYRARPVDTRRSFLIEAIFLGALAWSSVDFLFAFLGQAFVAIFLLEFVNYLQHHGLRRGQDERGQAHHAWESRHRWSRWTLLELPLHPSHHLKSSTPYQRLDVHDDAPQLPYGYYVMFWLALVPPFFSRKLKSQIQ